MKYKENIKSSEFNNFQEILGVAVYKSHLISNCQYYIKWMYAS